MESRKQKERILTHPFLKTVLGIEADCNKEVRRAIGSRPENIRKTLSLVLEAIQPIFALGWESNRRLTQLREKTQIFMISTDLQDIQVAQNPLPPLDLLKKLFESLGQVQLTEPKKACQRLLEETEIQEGNLLRAYAYVQVMDEIAGPLCSLLEDFIAQWQVANGLPSAKIQNDFLKKFSEVSDRPELDFKSKQANDFDLEKIRFENSVCQHLDRVHQKLQALHGEKTETVTIVA